MPKKSKMTKKKMEELQDVTTKLRNLVKKIGLIETAIVIKETETTNIKRWIKWGNHVPAIRAPYIADLIEGYDGGDQ